jgi:hypothetical protein
MNEWSYFQKLWPSPLVAILPGVYILFLGQDLSPLLVTIGKKSAQTAIRGNMSSSCSYSNITETNKIQLVLFGMQNRTFGPYLAANNRILISLMQRSRGLLLVEPPRVTRTWISQLQLWPLHEKGVGRSRRVQDPPRQRQGGHTRNALHVHDAALDHAQQPA